MNSPRLILCSGPQSSGSTLVSWCFLQRADCDGVLDAQGDQIPEVDPKLPCAYVWCKVTVSSFRLTELAAHFEDEGWQVRPMLVVRDMRSVFNSLITKSYGCNGLTAEEPPLRMRMRRFKADWQAAVAGGWPVMKYESLVTDPEKTLRQVCDQLHLPWDTRMMTWPKPMESIWAAVHGNPTFRATRGDGLLNTISPAMATLKVNDIPPADLTWLEEEFADFNAALGYPAKANVDPNLMAGRALRSVPSMEKTRRYRRRQRRSKVRLWFRNLPYRVLSWMGKNPSAAAPSDASSPGPDTPHNAGQVNVR